MSAARRIRKRLDATLAALAAHEANGRGVDAVVCRIRAQALREALADARGAKVRARLYLPTKED